MTVDRVTVLRWAEALAGVARTGLGFTESLYEKERFEEVLKIAADMRAHVDEDIEGAAVESALIYEAWLESVGQGVPGYVTPKSAVGAVVGDDEGRLLLVQRKDSGWWLYPTGWADVGYSPAEVTLKEVAEETGIEAEIVRLLGVFDPFRFGFGRVPLWMTLFHCRAVGGELQAHPLETGDVGFFARDELPEPLAIRPEMIDLVFSAIAGDPIEPYYDHPREP